MLTQGKNYQSFDATLPTPDSMLVVEREEHLLRMQMILDDVHAGHGQLVLIEGETGLGKTYIVQLLMRYAHGNGWRIAKSQSQSTTKTPYDVWRTLVYMLFEIEPLSQSSTKVKHQRQQHLKKVRATVQQINPEWLERLPLLGVLLDIPLTDTTTTAALDANLRQQALAAFMIDLVRWWAQQQPLLLVIDDCHHLDEASQRLMMSIARALSTLPIVLVMITQPTQPPTTFSAVLQDLAYCTTIQLNPCATDGTQLIIEQQLKSTPPSELVNFVHECTGGNPLFCVELISLLRETKQLKPSTNGWQWIAALDVATSVEHVIMQRLTHLPPQARTVAEYASVIGTSAELLVLQQVLPSLANSTTLGHLLHTLAEYNIIMPTQPYQSQIHFRHETIQRTLYTSLADEQRRGMHQTVAEALTHLRSEAVEQLAEHFGRAGQPQRALRYLEQAGERAQRESANQTALVCYEQLLLLEQRWTWQKKVIDLLHLQGRREEERTALEASAGLPDVVAADLALAWGQYYEYISDYDNAIEQLQQAYKLYHKKRQRAGEMAAILRLGQTARYQGDYDQAQRWYIQGLQSLEGKLARSLDTQEAQIRLLIGLGTVNRQQGDFHGARARYMQALHLATATSNPVSKAMVLNSLGSIAYFQRHFGEAHKYYEQALGLHRAIGNRPQEGTSLYNLAMTFQELSEYDRAREYLIAALGIQQINGNRWEEANIWNVIGSLEHELGNMTEALRCLKRAQHLAQTIGAAAIQGYIKANLGNTLADLAEFDQARCTLAEGLELALAQNDRLLQAYILSHLAILAIRTSQPKQAIELAHQALSLRQALKLELWTTADVATLAAAYSQLDQPTQATRLAHQAMKLLETYRESGLECPQRDYFVCFQVFMAANDPMLAQQMIVESYKALMQHANHISDPVQQHQFLHAVPLHRQIMQAHLEHLPDQSSERSISSSS